MSDGTGYAQTPAGRTYTFEPPRVRISDTAGRTIALERSDDEIVAGLARRLERAASRAEAQYEELLERFRALSFDHEVEVSRRFGAESRLDRTFSAVEHAVGRLRRAVEELPEELRHSRPEPSIMSDVANMLEHELAGGDSRAAHVPPGLDLR